MINGSIPAITYDMLVNSLKENLIYYSIEALKLASIDSKKSLYVKTSALASFIKNLRSCILNCSVVLSKFKKKNKTNHDLLSISINFYLGIENARFSLYDQNRLRFDQSKDHNNKRLKSSKIKQFSWLISNITIPYACLAIKRLLWDKADIRRALYCHPDESPLIKGSSLNSFRILSIASIISEDIRRNYFY